MASFELDDSLLARIAWMHYVQGQTHEEIGRALGFSRSKVTRLMATARERGVVEVNISGAYRSCLDSELAMKERFGLHEVIVVPTGDDIAQTREGVGMACASYLQKILKDGDVLGCAWGRAVYQVGRFLKYKRYHGITVVQLIGGLNVGANINPQVILEMIASKLNARGVWLHTPAVVGSPEIRLALLKDRGVRSVLDQGKRCTKALVGIGDVTADASLVASRALSARDMRELAASGAVGDIMARFFDSRGKPVRHEIVDRVLSVPLSDLKKVPLRIASTAGREKVGTIIGAARGGYINVLVKDESTIRQVLLETKKPK